MYKRVPQVYSTAEASALYPDNDEKLDAISKKKDEGRVVRESSSPADEDSGDAVNETAESSPKPLTPDAWAVNCNPMPVTFAKTSRIRPRGSTAADGSSATKKSS